MNKSAKQLLKKKEIYLDLDAAELSFSKRSLIKVTKFVGLLHNLLEIDFSQNCLNLLPTSFFTLTRLEKINVSQNYFVCLDLNPFSNLKELNCSLNKLETLTINECTNLTYLNVQYNNLSVLILPENSNFCMYLEYNQLTKIPNIPPNSNHVSLACNKLNNVQHTKSLSEYINIESLNLEKNKILIDESNYRTANFVTECVPENVDFLNLSFNEIYYLDFHFENKFCNLRILHLSNNKMESFSIQHHTLAELDVSYNLLKKLNLERCTNLSILNASHNSLSEVLLIQDKFEKIDLSYNQFTQMANLKQNTLKKINFENNLLEKINKTDFLFAPNIEVLNLSKNKIYKVTKELKCCSQIKQINLSNNPLHEIPQELNKEKILLFNCPLESK